MDTLVKTYLPLLHSDKNLKELFPANAFDTIYRRHKNLKELLSPLSFLTRKVLKAKASLLVIVVTSATIICFLKTCLLVQLLVRNTSLNVSYTVTPVMLYI